MFKYFYTFQITLLICAINIDCSPSKNEDYISQESSEITEINEIDTSVSKEGYNKNNSKNIDNNDSKQSKESSESSSKPPTKVNITSFHCPENKDFSSEESNCRSTLVKYPYSASIQKKGAHYASGALIHLHHVLTVAAEFYNVRETIKLFRVRLGSVDCKRNGLVLPIKLVDIHPLFVPGRPSFDLALIRLSEPVEVTEYIKPITLSKLQQGVISAKFLTTYWPRLIVKGKLLPKTAKERLKHNSMRVSTQRLIPWKTCGALMKARDAELDNTSLCLKPISTHHSPCMPDVGAPVLADDGLWGITSGWVSQQCSQHPSPTVFTRTAMPPIRSWLKSAVEAGSFKNNVPVRTFIDKSPASKTNL